MKIIPCSFAFNDKKCKLIKFGHLISEWYGKNLYHSYRRKLLGYSDKPIYENFLKNEQLYNMNTQSYKKEQKNVLKNTENPIEDHNELWDDWSNWSACSVTCGNGRQVRWRHCSAKHCMKGLKKAQIKTCRLKNCGSKNILHWLGIKSK